MYELSKLNSNMISFSLSSFHLFFRSLSLLFDCSVFQSYKFCRQYIRHFFFSTIHSERMARRRLLWNSHGNCCLHFIPRLKAIFVHLYATIEMSLLIFFNGSEKTDFSTIYRCKKLDVEVKTWMRFNHREYNENIIEYKKKSMKK